MFPSTQDHLLTEEEFAVLKVHVLTKIFDNKFPALFIAQIIEVLNVIIASLAGKTDCFKSNDFLQKVRMVVSNTNQNNIFYYDVCNSANSLTVTDAPVLIRLYK